MAFLLRLNQVMANTVLVVRDAKKPWHPSLKMCDTESPLIWQFHQPICTTHRKAVLVALYVSPLHDIQSSEKNSIGGVNSDILIKISFNAY